MNQTESVRKREGSGVGILCVREARCFGLRRRLRLEDGPRLPLHAYLTAPDINASTIAQQASQVLHVGSLISAKTWRAIRNSLSLPFG
ncbi:hypothetical protein ACWGLL_00050 [Brevundimonas sp. NPDC055814]